MFMPFQILGLWVRGLLSLVFLGAGITLLSLWFANRNYSVIEPVPNVQRGDGRDEKQSGASDEQSTRVRTVTWEFGWNKELAALSF
jgi:hypothetical protein